MTGIAGAVASLALCAPATAQHLHTERILDLVESEDLDSTTGPRPRPLSESTAPISAIDGDTLRAAGARYLIDVLRLVPGIEVIRTSSTESNVSLRGFSDASSAAQGITVLIDGHPVYNQFYGNNFFDTLPISIEDIDRIEIIRGPSSFKYGPNAMHGVINIISMPVGSHREHPRAFMSLSTRFGTYDSTLTTFRYRKWDPADQAGINATVVYDDIGQFDPGAGDTRNKRFANLYYQNQVGADTGHTFGLGGSISDQRFNLLIPQIGPIGTALYTADMREAVVKGDYRYGDLKAKASWTGFDTEAAADRFYAPVNVDLDTFDLDLQYAFPLLEDHFLSFGGSLNHSIFSTGEPDVSLGRHSATLLSAFVQDEVELVDDQLLWTMGARFDRHTIGGNNISPRLALVWKVANSHSLRVSYSTGFRNPSHRETWFDLPVTVSGLPPLTVGGNENLVAEKLRSFEFGYSGWFLPLPPATEATEGTGRTPGAPGGSLWLAVSLYHNRIDHQVQFPDSSTPTSTTIRPQNLGYEEAYGAEFEAKYLHSDALLSFANYSHGVRRDRATHVYSGLAPKHKANLGVQYSSGKWRAMGWATYFGATEHRLPVDDYLLLNGSVSYEVRPDLTLFLEGFNVLGDDHREHPEANRYGALLSFGVRVIL